MYKILSLLIICAALTSCKCIKKRCSSSPKKEMVQVTTTETTTETVDSADPVDDSMDVETKSNIVLDRVFFGFDSYDLTSAAKTALSDQAEWYKSHPEVPILITGHCDERGTRAYNIGLGERRANAAKEYLVSLGLSEDRIEVVSKGKDDPIVLGSNEDAWAQNRVSLTSAK